jgi:Protein of unknown function (DUF3426)
MTYAGLIAWALLGVLGLVFQTMVLFKDVLAAHQPDLQPALAQLCLWADCTVAPLKQADAVVIDHATIDPMPLSADAVDMGAPVHWAFEVHLRNSAKVPVATPWIELTLTDAQDQAVMRKVLDLSQWGAPPVMASGDILPMSLQLGLVNPEVNFVGYRLLTFYP